MSYDEQTRYQLKLTLAEAKEKRAKREFEQLLLKIDHLNVELADRDNSLKSLEDLNKTVQTQYFAEKELNVKLKHELQGCISKSKSSVLIAQNEELRIDVTQTKGALDTFRSLHEAAVRDVKTLRVAVVRTDDEIQHLRKEIRDMQSETDEKALIGKLFNQVLSEKWNEGAFNKKFETTLDDLRKARMDAKNYESKLKKKEDEYFEIHVTLNEKISILERELAEAKINHLPTVSLGKIEQLNVAMKKMAASKLDAEVSNKKFREENYELSVRLDSYVLREESLNELEKVLKNAHEDELEQKIFELSDKVSALKLAELKGQRENLMIKEREEYYIRISRTQTAQLQKLEEEIMNNETRFNEREIFWRKRYQDQLKMLSNKEEESIIHAKTEAELRNVMSAEMDKFADKNKMFHTSPSRVFDQNASQINFETANAMDKLKLMEHDIKYKDAKIEKLTKELESKKEPTINYQAKNVDVRALNDMESKTRDIAQAAQHTIATLQGLLEEKDHLLNDRETTIENLRKELTEKNKELRRIDIDNERMRKESNMNERNRLTTEQFSSLKAIQKLQNMDQRELEKLIIGYENKLGILADQLTSAEESNRELAQKLRNAKSLKAQNEISDVHNHSMNELDLMKKENKNLKEMYKKSQSQLMSFKEVVKNYKDDLLKKDGEIVLTNKTSEEKLLMTKNEGSEAEARIAALTKKYSELNDQLKEKNKLVQELKQNEIRSREKVTELNEANNKLSAANTKLKDDNSKLMVANAKKPASTTTVESSKRPASGIMKKDDPSKNKKMASNEERDITVLNEKVKMLHEENLALRTKAKPEFIDDEGFLVADTMFFRNIEEIYAVIRKYLAYMGPQTNLFAIMRRADSKDMGVAPMNMVLQELESSGIKFKDRDRTKFIEEAPKDHLGNIDYRIFYYKVKQIQDQEAVCKRDGGSGEGNLFSAKNKTTAGLSKDTIKGKDQNNINTLALDKNVDLLKKKLIEKQAELDQMQQLLTSWRKKALTYEEELKDKGNNSISKTYGVNSTLEARLGRKGEEIKQIRELEDQIRLLQKELKYEIDKREIVIREQQEDLQRKSNENTMNESEARSLRAQLERLLNSKISKDQIIEEKEKERDMMIASLKEKLEKSRKVEEEVKTKMRAIERENLDLKHIKDGIDTRLEGLNREIRELKDNRRL